MLGVLKAIAFRQRITKKHYWRTVFYLDKAGVRFAIFDGKIRSIERSITSGFTQTIARGQAFI